jgi:hypothetical protein
MKTILEGKVDTVDYHDTGTLVISAVHSNGGAEDIFSAQDKHVTILEGHLADQLRWKKMEDEYPKDGEMYVVQGYGKFERVGLCIASLDVYGYVTWWLDSAGKGWTPMRPEDVYRRAIAGLDYLE